MTWAFSSSAPPGHTIVLPNHNPSRLNQAANRYIFARTRPSAHSAQLPNRDQTHSILKELFFHASINAGINSDDFPNTRWGVSSRYELSGSPSRLLSGYYPYAETSGPRITSHAPNPWAPPHTGSPPCQRRCARRGWKRESLFPNFFCINKNSLFFIIKNVPNS